MVRPGTVCVTTLGAAGSYPAQHDQVNMPRPSDADKFSLLLDAYQSNVYPVMYDELANHLGVSADSLRRLGIGYAPIVEFKKGKNYGGWWAIPERDAHGNVRGLSLRQCYDSQDDVKVMHPGSKHGLIYEVNPDHEHGSKGYDAGPHNWIRTTDAGLLCPVCGKPDGCLLSAENPSNPRAAVCIRTESTKRLRFGSLHILKSDGNLTGRSALADIGGPLVIVEGASDTATAFDLGYQAIGRPSNLACLTEIVDLVRGYSGEIWIIGENDHKPDGKCPGKEGMEAAFSVLKGVVPRVKMVMPPPHIKDLRAWKTAFGLTREVLDAYVEQHGTVNVENVVIEDSRPLTIAKRYLSDMHSIGKRCAVKRWGGQWFRYDGGRYATIDPESFEAPLWQWAQNKNVTVMKADGTLKIVPLEATQGLAANVLKGVISEVLISAPDLPCWINGTEGPEPKDLIVFANGILNVPAYLAGKTEHFLDPTPDLFTTVALPFDFDPTAKCPNWLDFMRASLGDDPMKIALIREWIGYCMTADTSMQKMLFMRGPSCSGKGTILNTLTWLVGEDQTAATSFTDLSGPHGLSPLLNKTLVTVGDVRTPKNGDIMRGLELLLNIVGNDNVSVNPKNREQVSLTRLGCRIAMAGNEFLDLPDHANALLRRLLLLEFNETFVGREDFGLERKLKSEIAGIAVWALEGLQNLRKNNSFSMPQSSKEASGEWRLATNPLAAFVEECCDLDQGEVGKTELYDAWSSWSGERRIRPITKSRFFERMRFASPSIVSDTYESGVHKISVYKGVKLKAWAARRFTGRPSE